MKGPSRRDRRTRRHRRRDQSGHARRRSRRRSRARRSARATAGYSRVTVDANAPLDSRSPVRPCASAAMFTSSGVPGRDVVHNSSWGVAPSLSFGIGKPSRFTLAYQHLAQDNVPDYGLPWAAFEPNPRVDQSNFYGLEGYDYEDIDSDRRHRDVRARPARRVDAAQRLALGRQPPRLRDHRAAPAQPPAAAAAHGPGPAHQPDQRHRLVPHGEACITISSPGVEVGRETTFIRRQAQTDESAADRTSSIPIRARVRSGRCRPTTAIPRTRRSSLAGIYAFDTLQLGSRWELTARPALGFRRRRLRADERRHRRHDATRPRRPDAELERRRRLQAAHERQRLRQLRDVVQSVGRRGRRRRGALATCRPPANNVNLAPEKTPQPRDRRQVGDRRRPRHRHRRAVPHREDQRPHARRHDRAVRARRRAARRRRRARSHRPPHRSLVGPDRRTRISTASSSPRPTRSSRARRWRSSPRTRSTSGPRQSAARPQRRRGRAVHGLGVPQRHQHRRGAELLAGQRDGRV